MKIVVTPQELNSAAAQIDALSADYESLFGKLFSEVGALQSGWQGKDNVAFTNQIEGFKDDFMRMKQLMDDYSTFLKTSATQYKETQDNIAAAASQLAN